MNFLKTILNLHLDKRFSLLKDLEDIFTMPLLMIPIVLAFLLYWVTSIFVTDSIETNYILVNFLSPVTLVFFLQRLVLPITFVYILRRLLFEYRCKFEDIWMGIAIYLVPALGFLLFFWLTEWLLSYVGFFFQIGSDGVDYLSSLFFMVFNIFLVALVMGGRNYDLSFVTLGVKFIGRNYIVLLALWFFKEFTLVYGSLSGHFGFDLLINYIIYLVMALIYLRSSEEIVQQRGTNKTTVITVRQAHIFKG